jgi:hypothetical protein
MTWRAPTVAKFRFADQLMVLRRATESLLEQGVTSGIAPRKGLG